MKSMINAQFFSESGDPSTIVCLRRGMEMSYLV